MDSTTSTTDPTTTAERDPQPAELPEAGDLDVYLNRGQRLLLRHLAEREECSVAEVIELLTSDTGQRRDPLLVATELTGALCGVWLSLFRSDARSAMPLLHLELTGDAEPLERRAEAMRS